MPTAAAQTEPPSGPPPPSQDGTTAARARAQEIIAEARGQSGAAAAGLLGEAARLLREGGDIAGAVHALQQAVALVAGAEPGAGTDDRALRARLELALGRIFEEELGRLDGALLNYQRAYKLDQSDLTPLSRGRAIYRALGDVSMVSRLFELELGGAAGRDPGTALSLSLEYARLKLEQQRDPAGAAQLLRAALAKQPEDKVLPEAVLETLAEALVSPDYVPAEGETPEQAQAQASELYLALALRRTGRPAEEAPPETRDGPPAPSSEEGATAPPHALDAEALRYLRRALGADPQSAAAAVALERLCERLPAPERDVELQRLYRTGARVPRRALKLLSLCEAAGPLKPEERRELIGALRAGLEEADSIEEWQENRGALRRLLEAEGDQAGLADLLRADAAEAALPEERAELLLSAADLYRRAGDPARYLATLDELLAEDPLNADAFRRVCEYHGGRRDLAALARAHETRLAALLGAEEIEPAAHLQKLEELADLYEKKLGDLAAAADAWRRIDELHPSARSQGERRRLGQRLAHIQRQVSTLQLELDRTPPGAAGTRADLLRRLAQHHREQHEPTRAAELYEELLAFSPGDQAAIKALADLREVLGDVPGQIDALRRMAAAASGRAERLGLLRRLLSLSAGREGSAETTAWACRALLQELPSDREALRRLYETQELQGDGAGQLDTIEALLKVAPTPQEKLALHQQAARLCDAAADLGRAASHLERAVRLCPPGPELEAVLLELARIYGSAGRHKEQLQALELATKNARASAAAFRALGRATQSEPRDKALEDRALRAWAEVARRHPSDAEALDAIGKLQRARGEWRELAATLRRALQIPDELPERRLAVALQLADVLALRLDDRAGSVAVLEQVQGESPLCDRQLHHRLRALHEDLGNFDAAARYAERELLLTEDPLGRMELAMEIAALWRLRARDAGRALLSFERVAELLPPVDPQSVIAREGRRIIAQALDAQSELHAEAGRWAEVVGLCEERARLAAGEPMRAACILLEVAAVCEEKQGDARAGFALRRRAYELAPEMAPLAQLTQAAEAGALWAELCDVHQARVAAARAAGEAPPLDSLLAASRLLDEKLADRKGAFQLLRSALPTGAEGAARVAAPGQEGAAILDELLRVAGAMQLDGDATAQPLGRELLAALHGLVDDLCGRRGGATEDTAVALHRLLGAAARLREGLGDPRGALDERLRAFQLGGERDRGATEAATAVLRATIGEIRRLALLTGQIKEALQVDGKRLDRAEGEAQKREVAADAAAWLDDFGNDPPRALRACLKALSLAEEGSDLQAGLRARMFALGKRLGTLAWEEITRAERNLPAPDPRLLQQRLLHVARLWEEGAGEILRAIESIGQAYRAALTVPATDAALREELAAQRPALRAELDRLAQKAPSDSEGMGRVVSLLDGIAAALNDAGEGKAAAEVLLDAARCDERRGRLAHAERRYQEVLRGDPASDEALTQLERLYRQGRRFGDLVALLERRRSGLKERLPAGPARRAMFLELGELYQQLGKSFEALDVFASMASEDDADPEPHHRMARLHEAQRAFARAAEALQREAERSAGEPARALHALLRSGELWEKNVGSPERALAAYQAALAQAPVLDSEDDDASEDAGAGAEVAPRRDVAAGAGSPTANRAEQAGARAAAAMAATADVQLALAGAERVLDKLGRSAELDVILARRIEELARSGAGAATERALLLRRRLRLLRGPMARQEGARAKALACAEELAQVLPDDDDALQLLGQLLGEAGEAGRARTLLRRRAEAAARRGEPPAQQATLWAQAAQLVLGAGDAAEAEALVDRARSLNPDDLDSLAALAELRRHHGDARGRAEALEELAARAKEGPRAVEALLEAAAERSGPLGEGARARTLLERLLAQLPDAEVRSPAARRAVSMLADLTLAAGDNAAAEGYARRELGLVDVKEDATRAAELRTRLGRLLAARGEADEAERQLRAALELRPGLLAATRGLVALLAATDREDAGEQREALLGEALTEGPEPLDEATRAALLRQLGEVQLSEGKLSEALVSLRAAEALVPGGARDQITLGETAFQLGDYDIAARHLGSLLGTAAAASEAAPATLADALTHGAQALLRGAASPGEPALLARARALLEEALRLAPAHEEAEEAYGELLLRDEAPRDDLEMAVALAERQAARRDEAGDHTAAARRYRQAAQLALHRVDDRRRAEQLLDAATAALRRGGQGPGERALAAELTEVLCELAESAGDLDKARRAAQSLVELAEGAAARAAARRRLAELSLRAGDEAAGCAELRRALDDDARQLGALTRLVGLLPDPEAAALLDERLPRAEEPSPDAGTPAPRELAEAWALLGALRGRLAEAAPAAVAYDRAIGHALATGGAQSSSQPAAQSGNQPGTKTSAGARPSAAATVDAALLRRLREGALAAIGTAEPEAARRHLDALRAERPLDQELLERLLALETHLQRRGAARRVAEVLAVLHGAQAPDGPPPPIPAGLSLPEEDHALIGDPAARVMAEVMATIWEGIAAPKAPAPESLGVAQGDRIPPVESSQDPVARAFALCCRVLGNRKPALYRGAAVEVAALVARPPVALVAGQRLWQAPPAQALFLIGRAVELLRPEYILSEAIPRAELSRLLGLAVHAFHPRHVRSASEAVAAWRRELPYRAVKRLSDLLRELADVEFSTGRWRRSVRRAGNRAGLLLCADLAAARAALESLGGDEVAADLDDLARFWLSAEAGAIADRVRPPQ